MAIDISAVWEVKITYVQEFCPGTSNTLLTTLYEDLVWRQRFAGLASRPSCLARENDLDVIFILQPYDVFTVLTDER